MTTVTQAKYLGVIITTDPNYKQPIENVTKSANNAITFWRDYSIIDSFIAKELAYLTYILPILEYFALSGIRTDYTNSDNWK